MLYIHHTSCILDTGGEAGAEWIRPSAAAGCRVLVAEPAYPGIPANVLRRMGKMMRMGSAVCLPLSARVNEAVAGIIIGTSNGGTEDSFRFLQQMMQYGEEMLSPGGFVQSTANAFAAQLSLMLGNKGYNSTHVHRGLAFEQALQDAVLLSAEDPNAAYLVAGIDELSHSNFILDTMQGWYKPEDYTGGLYDPPTPGTLAGEGAAAFVVSGRPQQALAALRAHTAFHSDEPAEVAERLSRFLAGMPDQQRGIDLFISGENGDSRLAPLVGGCEALLPAGIPVVRYKHCCGEYPTASAVALWIACRILGGERIPDHLMKRGQAGGLMKRGPAGGTKNILVYNHNKGQQHSFWLVSAVDQESAV